MKTNCSLEVLSEIVTTEDAEQLDSEQSFVLVDHSTDERKFYRSVNVFSVS